jgi:hypothetical protein
VSNLTDVQQKITGYQLHNPGADEFRVTGGTCLTNPIVDSKTSCTYDITFTPTSTMSVGVDFFVTSNAICGSLLRVDTLAPGVPLPSPTPTAVLGADVMSASVSEVAAPGSTVPAGTFTVRNDLAIAETIASATVSVSDPGMFSSMTLKGAGQSVTVTPPTASTTFTFTAPVTVPARGSLTFTLTAVIAAHPAMLGNEIKYAGLTLTDALPITPSTWPLAGGLLMLGIALMGLPDGTRRRAILIAALGLGVAAAAAGCGGSSSNPAPALVSSTQQLTAVADTANGTPEPVGGLPTSLSKIGLN